VKVTPVSEGAFHDNVTPACATSDAGTGALTSDTEGLVTVTGGVLVPVPADEPPELDPPELEPLDPPEPLPDPEPEPLPDPEPEPLPEPEPFDGMLTDPPPPPPDV